MTFSSICRDSILHRALKLLVAGVTLLATGCEYPAPMAPSEQSASADVTYRIPAGQHTADQGNVRWMTSDQLRFSATFDASARYETQDPSNQKDINKLYGFSDCNSFHHTNSARFGWSWEDNQLHIHAYCYDNGSRQTVHLGTAALNKAYQYEILTEGDTYTFRFDGRETKMKRGCSSANQQNRYLLYPYFGGNERAPHDILIQIQML